MLAASCPRFTGGKDMQFGVLIGLAVVGNLLLTLFARFILLTIFTELSSRTVDMITVGVFVYLTALAAWIIYKAGTMKAG